MNNKKPETKDKIMKVVIGLVGKKGNINLTAREISKKARVNLASINYYFSSIKSLFSETEKFFASKMRKVNLILETPGPDPRKKIIDWPERFMDFFNKHPGILWVIGNRILRRDGADLLMGKFFKANTQPLYNLIKAITGIKSKKTLALKTVQIVSGIVGPLILYYGVKKGSLIDLSNKKIRKDYISSLVDSVLDHRK